MIGIIDYNAGNLRSVIKAFTHIGAPCKLVKHERDAQNIERLLLPGVGAFRSAIENLKIQGVYDLIARWLEQERPFLGICLGLQILCEKSEESTDAVGFARIPVTVKRFTEHKVPQIGWNQVTYRKSTPLMEHIKDGTFFYFLHSYYVPAENDTTIGVTDYGIPYASIIIQDRICAVQFHPEKSGKAGLQLLKNWVALC